jgi:hypothetical protein
VLVCDALNILKAESRRPRSSRQKPQTAPVLGEFTNNVGVNVYNRVISQKKEKHQSFVGSPEDCKGSGCCIAHLIKKQKLIGIALEDLQWPAGCHGKV